MKATWNNTVIAEAKKDDLIYIENTWYFPPDALNKDFFKSSTSHTVCYWKGLASYYDVEIDGQLNNGAAWYYPKPTRLSKKIVKKDFSHYVAFWHGVEVKD
jgi:uncharacterized protein (DUF427 family)